MKHIASNVLIYIKNNCISMFLVFSALLMCLVHAIPAAVWADFSAINGDFQNYNVVRRFLDGQTIYTDFAAYLGYGHLLIGSVLTFIFGAGDPTLSSSKMAFCFAAILAFALWSYAVYWAVFHKYGKVIPLIATNIMLLLILVDPAFFANAMSLTADLHQAMQGSLATGNSARFLRELAPVIFVFICVILYWLKGRIKLINQSEILSLGFVFGIPAGIIFYYSNDYGVSSVVSVTVIICLSILFKELSKNKMIKFELF